MQKFKIRFNKQHNGSGLDWKVFTNDRMFLARHININVPSVTTLTVEDNQPHWNIVCYGYSFWYDDVLNINKENNNL
jgi:hypothetical protein